MDQVVLRTNLRFVILGLNLEERGQLLTALLDECEENLGERVENLYRYILTLQEERETKKQRMRVLGALGGKAKKRKSDEKTADLFGDEKAAVKENVALLEDAQASLNLKRKEAKENNILNINKKIKISVDEKKESMREEVMPSLDIPKIEEVRAFVKDEGLLVDPEEFVDFYDSHGWAVGKTPIKNWQATLKLWHRRAVGSQKKKGRTPKTFDDESYWSELFERQRKLEKSLNTKCEPVPKITKDVATPELAKDEGVLGEGAESPFARFMRRIENNDISEENDHER